jgi:hypothetical protein
MLVQSKLSSLLMSGSEIVNLLSSHLMRVYCLSQGSDMAICRFSFIPLWHVVVHGKATNETVYAFNVSSMGICNGKIYQ